MKFFSRSTASESAPAAPENRTELRIEGMSCSACSAHVEAALRAVAGVTAAQVDLANHRASVSGAAPQKALLEAVEEAGYSAVAA